MHRVVDLWAAWYAALSIFVGVFLLTFFGGLFVAFFVTGNFLRYVDPIGWLIGLGLAVYAFRNVAKGLIYDPASHSVDMPRSQRIGARLKYWSLTAYAQLLQRERIAIADIRALGEREETLFDGRGRFAGTSYYLDLDGSFGTRAVHFRSQDTRAEARDFFEHLVKTAPPGKSRIPGTGSASSAS